MSIVCSKFKQTGVKYQRVDNLKEMLENTETNEILQFVKKVVFYRRI